MKLNSLNVFSFLVVFDAHIGNAANILGIFPQPMKSHSIIGCSLMKELAGVGHEITVITPFPENKNISNYREISTETIIAEYQSGIGTAVSQTKGNPFKIFNYYMVFTLAATENTLRHPNVQKILNNPNEKFDLIVMAVTLNEALLGFGHYFQAPVIGLSTISATKWTNEMVGTPAPYSFIPSLFLSFTEKMTFIERMINVIFTTYEHIVFIWIFMANQAKLYDTHFPNPKPPLSVLQRNVSLVLLNSHFSLSFPKPFVPNMIEVGGLYVNRDGNRLPADIQDIFDNASNGVIYFSLGSNLKSTLLTVAVKNDILKVFSRLNLTVFWKLDSELKENLPNVHIRSWFPQDSILAHPKTILFITHGGLLSSTEAVYHGVPTIGIPLMGDQEWNVARAVLNGFCIKLAFEDINEYSLQNAIEEILNNKTYTERAKILSARFRDQPHTPMETAIYWVEYIIRHKGAPHMRNPGLDLNFFQYHSLDVFGVILGLFLVFSFITVRLIKVIVTFMHRKVSGKLKTN